MSDYVYRELIEPDKVQTISGIRPNHKKSALLIAASIGVFSLSSFLGMSYNDSFNMIAVVYALGYFAVCINGDCERNEGIVEEFLRHMNFQSLAVSFFPKYKNYRNLTKRLNEYNSTVNWFDSVMDSMNNDENEIYKSKLQEIRKEILHGLKMDYLERKSSLVAEVFLENTKNESLSEKDIKLKKIMMDLDKELGITND